MQILEFSKKYPKLILKIRYSYVEQNSGIFEFYIGCIIKRNLILIELYELK